MERAHNFCDLAGVRFGRLTVSNLHSSGPNGVLWMCGCDCGASAIVDRRNLRAGRQKSCGCLNAEIRKQRNEARKTTDEHKLSCKRARSLKWARKNSDSTKRRYLQAKSDPIQWAKILESARQWNHRNRTHKNAMTRNRRAKIKNAEGSHTKVDIQDLLLAQDGKCAICAVDILAGFHVDHIQPLSRGGRNDKPNLQLLCAPCNLSKWAHDPETFMKSLGAGYAAVAGEIRSRMDSADSPWAP